VKFGWAERDTQIGDGKLRDATVEEVGKGATKVIGVPKHDDGAFAEIDG
jgi:hypothetical protein